MTIPAPAPSPAPDPVQMQAAYQQAFKLLQQSRYDQSIKAFRAFLLAHPGSEYADKAQFWLAEACFVSGRYAEAMQEYVKLLRQYPHSLKSAQAKLKIGYSFQELGQLNEARTMFTLLIDQHPDTTAARLARERLASLAALPAGTQGPAAAEGTSIAPPAAEPPGGAPVDPAADAATDIR